MNKLTFENERSLIAVYQRYSTPLYRFAYRLLGDQHLAEDCVSEVFSRFLHLVKRRNGQVENIKAYLYRMAHNWANDYYRQSKNQPVELEEDVHQDHNANPAHQVMEDLNKRQLRTALMSLPVDQRQVIIFRFLEGWSHEEVAKAMNRSAEATRALQYRALKNLRQHLSLDRKERHNGKLSK